MRWPTSAEEPFELVGVVPSVVNLIELSSTVISAVLAVSAENRRLAKEYVDKERLVRAEENSARQTERQADALEKRNDIEEERLDDRNRVYINPYYNRYSTPRRHPEHRPRPKHGHRPEHSPRPTPYPEKTLSIRIKK